MLCISIREQKERGLCRFNLRDKVIPVLSLAFGDESGYNTCIATLEVGAMERWIIENQGTQTVLTHYCDIARPNDGNDILSQDIGGGYVRCLRCGDKYLPPSSPGKERLLLRLKVPEMSGPVPY